MSHEITQSNATSESLAHQSIKAESFFEQQKFDILRILNGPATKARTQSPPNYPSREAATGIASYSDPNYHPVYFAEPKIYGNPQQLPKWASPLPVEQAEREQFLHSLQRYPGGPTGIYGPGVLGKPVNWAADPIVFSINPESGEIYQLQILRDNNEWGIPGGMVENQDSHLSTALRELEEETGVILSNANPVQLYQGPVDDYRNTDTHYIASSVYLFIVPWEEASNFEFGAADQDEIKDIKLRKLAPETLDNLFAAHTNLVNLALSELGANIDKHVPSSELKQKVLSKILGLLVNK